MLRRVLRCLVRCVRVCSSAKREQLLFNHSNHSIQSFNNSNHSNNVGTEDWCNVANVPGLSNRNSHHCLLRWKCRLDPDIKFGYWMAEEDLRLLMSARAYHGHKSEDQPWSEIGVQIPGRVGAQCAERFKKNLNPNIKKTTKWTSTEQKKFRRLSIEYVIFVVRHYISPTTTSSRTDTEQRVGLKLRLTWVHERIGVVFNIKKLSRNKKLQRRKTKNFRKEEEKIRWFPWRDTRHI